MKTKPSFMLNEITQVNKYKKEPFFGILDTAFKNENTLNESNTYDIQEFLEEAVSDGWYPFVSYVNEGKNDFPEIINIPKDELIFNLLMLEYELETVKTFSDIDIGYYESQIKLFKEVL